MQKPLFALALLLSVACSSPPDEPYLPGVEEVTKEAPQAQYNFVQIAKWNLWAQKISGSTRYVTSMLASEDLSTGAKKLNISLTRWVNDALANIVICTTTTPYIEVWDIYASTPIQNLSCTQTYPSVVYNATSAHVAVTVRTLSDWNPTCCTTPRSKVADYYPDIFAWGQAFYQGMTGNDPPVRGYVSIFPY